jgi:4-diphosphocytidyl-2-C-methyl-D-erythritol kinase
MIKEKAYAKINLFLNVLDKRKDGFHDLEMIMAPLAFCDVLKLSRRQDDKIEVASNVEITENVEDNLVYKVAVFMKEEFQVETGVNISIDKKIPLAAGLAGGSADAAATIRGLNRLWKLNLSNDDMAKIGIEFGSDIPFCIYNKMAIARGKGEELTFVNTSLKGAVLLINPNIELSTKEVFSNVKKEELVQKSLSKLLQGIKAGDLDVVSENLYNYLEMVSFILKPQVRGLKNSLKNEGFEGVLMTGSGSTVFVLDKRKKALVNLCKKVDQTFFTTLTKFL